MPGAEAGIEIRKLSADAAPATVVDVPVVLPMIVSPASIGPIALAEALLSFGSVSLNTAAPANWAVPKLSTAAETALSAARPVDVRVPIWIASPSRARRARALKGRRLRDGNAQPTQPHQRRSSVTHNY